MLNSIHASNIAQTLKNQAENYKGNPTALTLFYNMYIKPSTNKLSNFFKMESQQYYKDKGLDYKKGFIGWLTRYMKKGKVGGKRTRRHKKHKKLKTIRYKRSASRKSKRKIN